MIFLVTGASRGLGLEFVTQLLAANHHVIAWCRSPDRSQDLKNLQAEHEDRLHIDYVDVTEVKEIQKAASRIEHLDVLINNAGVLLDAELSFENLTSQTVTKTLETNLLGPVFVTQSVIPALGQSDHALIVNLSSVLGSITENTSSGYYAYRMSKTALNMFTKSLSVDYPKIKTLCVHPGWVQTDMGGAKAPIKKEKSIESLLKIILEPQKYKSGSFLGFSGKELPW